MLVLTRKAGEWIQIDEDTLLQITEIRGRKVRLGILAPPHVDVLRTELLDEPEVTREGGKGGFLILTRSKNEGVQIGSTTVTVLHVGKNAIRLGFNAPPNVRVQRVQRAA